MEISLLPETVTMLAFGGTLLYGGLALFVSIAYRKEKAKLK